MSQLLSDEEKAALVAAQARAEQLWGESGCAWIGRETGSAGLRLVGTYGGDNDRHVIAQGLTWEEAFAAAEQRCAPGLVAELATATAELKKREEEVNLWIVKTAAADSRAAKLRATLAAIRVATNGRPLRAGEVPCDCAPCKAGTLAATALLETTPPVSAEDARARNLDHAVEHGPTPLRENGAAEAAGQRSTFVVARDLGTKKIKLGGLGSLGVGMMWFDETPEHQSYAGYAEAPLEELGFAVVAAKSEAEPAAKQESAREARSAEPLSIEEGVALSAAKLRAYGLYASCGDAVRARGGGLYSVVLREAPSGAGILLGQGKTWEEAFADTERRGAPGLVAEIAELRKSEHRLLVQIKEAVDRLRAGRSTDFALSPLLCALMPHAGHAAASEPTAAQEIVVLQAQIAHLEDALHRDKTGLAAALGQIRATVNGRAWVAEGRGPYEWDDDRYRAEAGDALRTVAAIAESALRSSGDLARMALNRGPARVSETERELAAVVDRVREAGAWLAAAGFDDSPPGCGPVHRMLARLKTALRVLSSYENEKHRRLGTIEKKS